MKTNGTEAHLTALRRHLVEELQRRGVLNDQRIAEAFIAIPRHLFLPDVAPERVYSDQAILTKEDAGLGLSSSSQPAMMAIMLEQLQLESGMRVLEIGAGTGYNAAILRFLVGARGQVTTIDVDDDIVTTARAQIAASGYTDVHAILGDGGYGYPPNAYYDRIILTVGAPDVLPAWREQLRPNGLLVLPLSIGPAMYSLALRLLPDDTLSSESLSPCGFIRLRGAFASQEQTHTFGPWQLTAEPDPELALAQLPTLLSQAAAPLSLPKGAGAAQLFLFFALTPLAYLRHIDNHGYYATLNTSTMSGCTLPSGQETTVTLFGTTQAYEQLRTQLDYWIRLGRPTLADLRILVIPQHHPLPPNALMITRATTTLVLTRRDGRPIPALRQ